MQNCVFMFSGQGSQYAGMYKTLSRFPEFVETYRQASDVLRLDLIQICSRAPQELLNRTELTQPIVLTHGVAINNVLNARGVFPDAAAGHSVGEFGALVAAKAIGFEDALRIVQKRGALMSSVRRKGAMASVAGLERGVIERFCAEVKGEAIIALRNTHNQFVVSGDAEAVEELSEMARRNGALKVAPLKVSHAFHSPLMAEIAGQYGTLMDSVQFSAPACPLVMNSSANFEHDAEVIRANLKKQITSPVYWYESMRTMLACGYEHFIEAGPGRTLCGFMRSVNPQTQTFTGDSAKVIAELTRQ